MSESYSTTGAPRARDQLLFVGLSNDPPAEIESTIAALTRTRDVIDAIFIARDVPRRYHDELGRWLRERPIMTVQHVREAVLAYLAAPDEAFLFSRFTGVSNKLRGFDSRMFA